MNCVPSFKKSLGISASSFIWSDILAVKSSAQLAVDRVDASDVLLLLYRSNLYIDHSIDSM